MLQPHPDRHPTRSPFTLSGWAEPAAALGCSWFGVHRTVEPRAVCSDSARRRDGFHADVLRQTSLDRTRKRSRSFRIKDSSPSVALTPPTIGFILNPHLLLPASDVIIRSGKAFERSNIKQYEDDLIWARESKRLRALMLIGSKGNTHVCP